MQQEGAMTPTLFNSTTCKTHMEKEHFLKNGWFILNFIDPSPVLEAREQIEKKLADLVGKKVPLEKYHLEAEDDSFHTDLQIKLTQFYRDQKWGPRIIAKQLPLFQGLLGPDLYVQANPYLRITRPHKPQDNIGYHRDTFYGGSPYELSVLVPFVDVPPESSLSVLSGSHITSEEAFPTHQVISEDVTKGSSKHQLGFLYAPKLMDESIEKEMQPIPLKVGQALVFSLSTVHGSRINNGPVSRWSSDIRVMHAMAPVDLSARSDYYQQLSQSVVTQAANQYFYGKEKGKHVELELCHSASGKS